MVPPIWDGEGWEPLLLSIWRKLAVVPNRRRLIPCCSKMAKANDQKRNQLCTTTIVKRCLLFPSLNTTTSSAAAFVCCCSLWDIEEPPKKVGTKNKAHVDVMFRSLSLFLSFSLCQVYYGVFKWSNRIGVQIKKTCGRRIGCQGLIVQTLRTAKHYIWKQQ